MGGLVKFQPHGHQSEDHVQGGAVPRAGRAGAGRVRGTDRQPVAHADGGGVVPVDQQVPQRRRDRSANSRARLGQVRPGRTQERHRVVAAGHQARSSDWCAFLQAHRR